MSTYYEKNKHKPEFRARKNKENKAWRERNKERFKQMQKEWMEENPFYYFLNNARYRAKQQNVPFDLKISDLRSMVIPEVCPYLGIPIIKGRGKSSENSPSLDKIIPEKGYVVGNVEFISSRANRLKNDGSLEELEAIVTRLRTLTTY